MKYIIGLLMVVGLVGCGENSEVVQSSLNPQIVTQEIQRTNLKCEVYDLQGLGFNSLPDFDTIQAVKKGTLYVDQLDVVQTNNTVAFSKFVGTSYESIVEYFGLRCTAILSVPEDGTYLLRVNSDDGFKLAIDGTTVISYINARSFASTSANKYLTKGDHPIKIEYFQSSGNKGLFFSWKVPSQPVETLVSANNFKVGL